MKYPYQQFPDYCLYNSIPYYHQDRCERESSTESLTDVSSNCLEIGDLSKKYGVLNEKEGFTYRATFIIDPEGSIQAIFINPLSVGRFMNTIQIEKRTL